MTHLAASSYWELFEGPDVIYEQIHQPQFVTEPNQYIETTGVQSYAVGFLCKLLVELHIAVQSK